MQMLAVKLGVATGLNLAQHCRYACLTCIPPSQGSLCSPFCSHPDPCQVQHSPDAITTLHSRELRLADKRVHMRCRR
jgi:hypothetical protein